MQKAHTILSQSSRLQIQANKNKKTYSISLLKSIVMLVIHFTLDFNPQQCVFDSVFFKHSYCSMPPGL